MRYYLRIIHHKKDSILKKYLDIISRESNHEDLLIATRLIDWENEEEKEFRKKYHVPFFEPGTVYAVLVKSDGERIFTMNGNLCEGFFFALVKLINSITS